ncbi:MAG: ABC transporter substrate-binding protein [Thermoanaerobaculia bacterium]
MSRRSFLAALAALPSSRLLGEAGAGPEARVFGRLPPPGRIRRVFAAGPPAAVLARVLAPERLLGWPMQIPPGAHAFLAPAVRGRPFLGRLSGRGSTMPLEKLLALEPDLILDTGTVDATYLSAAESVHERTGIPYLLVPGRLAESPWQLSETGRRLGVPERGAVLAREAERLLAEARGAGRRGGARAPRVYIARGPDGLETVKAGSLNAESLDLAGGVSVARGPGGGVARVSFEQVAAWVPDVVLTQDAGFFANARQDDLWRRLPALRTGRFHLVPKLPFGWLDEPPGVNRLVGLPWLASRLHGTATGSDEAGRVRAFHLAFYGFAPELAAFERLLAGS